MRMLKKNNIH